MCFQRILIVCVFFLIITLDFRDYEIKYDGGMPVLRRFYWLRRGEPGQTPFDVAGVLPISVCVHTYGSQMSNSFANGLYSYSPRSRVQNLRLLFLHWIPFSLLRCLCAAQCSKLISPVDRTSFSFFCFFLFITASSMKTSVE